MQRVAKCVGSWLHRFRIERDTPEWVEEICEICGKRVIHSVWEGRIDNKRYAEYNARLFLQPNHPQYEREYGN